VAVRPNQANLHYSRGLQGSNTPQKRVVGYGRATTAICLASLPTGCADKANARQQTLGVAVGCRNEGTSKVREKGVA